MKWDREGRVVLVTYFFISGNLLFYQKQIIHVEQEEHKPSDI